MSEDKATSQRFLDVPVSHGLDVPQGVVREFAPLKTQDGVIISSVLYHRRGIQSKDGLVFMHPTADFLQHYALGPLAAMGYAALGVNSRYAGNESVVIMENLLLDLAAAIQYLRNLGVARIVLVGNSGGASPAVLYQSQAEKPKITSTPAGEPPDLTKTTLPAVDALILLNAHRGRAQVLTDWLDPSVVDEHDPFAVDSSLDMYDARNAPPYSQDFLTRYRAAQQERNRRITAWVRAKADELAQRSNQGTDIAFIVYRTAADPRFLDMSIDPSDRTTGTYWGDARGANYQAGGLARFTTLRSWLSQWGTDTSNALADKHIVHCSVPLLVIQSTADQGVFSSDVQLVYEAATVRDKQLRWLQGGTHFLIGQPDLTSEMFQIIDDWLRERNFDADQGSG